MDFGYGFWILDFGSGPRRKTYVERRYDYNSGNGMELDEIRGFLCSGVSGFRSVENRGGEVGTKEEKKK